MVEVEYAAPAEALSALAARWSAEIAAGAGDSFRRATLPHQVAWAEQWAPFWGGEEGSRPTARTFELQALGVAGVALLLCPGEPFVEYALALKRAYAGRMLAVGFANDAPGYLPTAAAYAQGGYEVELAYQFYGEPGGYQPGIEASLAAALDSLAAEMVRC